MSRPMIEDNQPFYFILLHFIIFAFFNLFLIFLFTLPPLDNVNATTSTNLFLSFLFTLLPQREQNNERNKERNKERND